jgi:5-methylcytosine-specific restriction protein A
MMPGMFRAPWMPPKVEHDRAADRARGSARARGYTAAWDRTSIAYLQANPICKACEAAGLTALATVTDHVVPHRGDRSLFWDAGNRQPACDWHHNVVKQRLEALFEAGRIGVAELSLVSAYALALAAQLRRA